MPEAELNGEDAYRFEIEERKELLADVVSESKPLVDFLALITAHVAVSAVVWLLAAKALGGLSLQLFFGLCAAMAFWLLLLGHVTRAFRLIAEITALKVRARLRLPADLHERHLATLALWRATLSTAEVCVVWGSGYLVAEIIKTSASVH